MSGSVLARPAFALLLVSMLAAPGGAAAVAKPGRGGVVTVPAAGTVPSRPVAQYRAPVDPVVLVRAFEAPPTPYSAGHRGVDLQTRPGQRVVAAAAGRVSFAGDVAGRGLVVIAHADGVRTEYEPVTPTVRAGQTVTAGGAIGVVRGHHGRCGPGRCLHWGAKRAGQYFDPLDLLRPLGPVRLLPWTGPPS